MIISILSNKISNILRKAKRNGSVHAETENGAKRGTMPIRWSQKLCWLKAEIFKDDNPQTIAESRKATCQFNGVSRK